MNGAKTMNEKLALRTTRTNALEAQVRMATHVCRLAAEGNLEPRILHIDTKGPMSELFLAINNLLDLTDAFVRESSASLQHASHDRYFRRVLPRGLHGSFRTAAGKINAATESMGQKALELQRMKGERLQMANDFESALKSLVDSLASAAQQVRTSAEGLTECATVTAQRSVATGGASENASNSVQAVAAATEEMGASIEEITRQVVHSTNVARTAAEQTKVTMDSVSGLGQVTSTINDIVKAINAVASQTKLLALNAAIEAARAGDAGRGFAVVAQEVKTLAGQTSRATAEIDAQISAIREVIGSAASAIAKVGATVNDMNDIATVISAAVTEQGAATQEIARNAELAAEGTRLVSTHVGAISEDARQTGSAAASLLASAGELSTQSEILRAEVDRFLRKIREDG